MPETPKPQVSYTQKPALGVGHLLSRLRSYLIFDPLIWIYTIILGAVSLFCSLFDRDGSLQHRIARLWSRMILGTIGVHVHVIGMEKVDPAKPHIYAVNHLSALDVPVLYKHLPSQFRILAKKELFRYPFLGWHLRRSGQIAVDQENVRNAVRSMGRAVESLKANMSVMIFPEGGRSEDGQLQGFMAGAFYLGIKAQVDVVPMALVGTYEILPMNTGHIMPQPVFLLVGDSIPTTGLTLRDLENLTQQARHSIAELYYSRASFPDLRDQHLEKNSSRPEKKIHNDASP